MADVILGNGVEIIGGFAFWCCRKLKSIVLPDSIKSIGNNAFEDCLSDMTEIYIPSSVTYVGSNAFKGSNFTSATFGCSGEAAKNVALSSLKEITLTADVENFEGYPFNSLSNLEKLNCFAVNPPKLTSSQFTDEQFDNLNVHVTAEAFNSYEYASVWSVFLNLKGDLVNGIEGVTLDPTNNSGKMFNLNGVQVGDAYKGIVIQNGKKVLRK